VKEPKRVSKTDKESEPEVHYDVLGDFCPCYFFAKQCLSEKGSSLVCKHVLASKLAVAIAEGTVFRDKLVVKEIED
jgi:predicted nucleic acid-binding Zn finger protein